MWASWPQACMTPVCWPLKVVVAVEANGRPVCSVTGNASMSARSATFGPGSAPSTTAVTPWWAIPVRTSSPSARRCSATLAEVCSSRLDSSGCWWNQRRSSTTSAATRPAWAATSGRCCVVAAWAVCADASGASAIASSAGSRDRIWVGRSFGRRMAGLPGNDRMLPLRRVRCGPAPASTPARGRRRSGADPLSRTTSPGSPKSCRRARAPRTSPATGPAARARPGRPRARPPGRPARGPSGPPTAARPRR